MDREKRNSAPIYRFVDVVAGQVIDPVNRLRFLKYAAPHPAPAPAPSRNWVRFVRIACVPGFLLAVLLTTVLTRAGAPAKAAAQPDPVGPPAVVQPPVHASSDVWKVEDTGGIETYSNGLRIDNRFSVANHPRSYLVFPIGDSERRKPVPATRPAGIVFHTTESCQAPLEERENRRLQQLEHSLIEFVAHKRAYNFLIDRFGRVYRIVAESDAANHAGYSVWADETSVYLNLNESFLGVSFEADTQPGQVESSVSAAQIRAAEMLTEMLRRRYAIPAANCVTHAQVSVNPANMRVGYHTDWASSFPYEQLGLPNNYARASAAIALFGFECDSHFLHSAGSPQYAGIEAAEGIVRTNARRSGLTLSTYRKLLQQRYKARLAEGRHGLSIQEEGAE